MKNEGLTAEQKAAAKAEAIRRLQPRDENDMLSQLTGDFDDNLNDIANPSLEKLLKPEIVVIGGGNGNGNGNGNGSRKGIRNKEQEKQLPEYSTFKYSTRFTGPLHEAILLGSGGEPVFVRYSASTGHLELVKKIEETNRILVPPYPEEYPYEPFTFQSVEELLEYENMATYETADSLFQQVKIQVSLYIDQDTEVINLISADIVWTFFQDLYPTTHYYDVTGKENGIGKSTIGYVFGGLAYRGARMTDPNSANLYRLMGKIEPGQCIVIADEADRIHSDKDMLAIWKEGYGIDGKVARVNTLQLIL